MTVKECISVIREDEGITHNELAQKLNVATPTLYNTLNNDNGMKISVQKLVKYAEVMGFQLVLKKDGKELIIDGKTELPTANKSEFEHIMSFANCLTRPGEPLPTNVLTLRNEREKRSDKLLKDIFVHGKEVDVAVELHKIWPDDNQMYNYYMFVYRNTKERTDNGEIAFV